MTCSNDSFIGLAYTRKLDCAIITATLAGELPVGQLRAGVNSERRGAETRLCGTDTLQEPSCIPLKLLAADVAQALLPAAPTLLSALLAGDLGVNRCNIKPARVVDAA